MKGFDSKFPFILPIEEFGVFEMEDIGKVKRFFPNYHEGLVANTKGLCICALHYYHTGIPLADVKVVNTFFFERIVRHFSKFF